MPLNCVYFTTIKKKIPYEDIKNHMIFISISLERIANLYKIKQRQIIQSLLCNLPEYNAIYIKEQLFKSGNSGAKLLRFTKHWSWVFKHLQWCEGVTSSWLERAIITSFQSYLRLHRTGGLTSARLGVFHSGNWWTLLSRASSLENQFTSTPLFK